MSRPGVTYQDIVAATHELKGQGKSITIENIRTHLGTGSIGTINKYLRQWREMEASTGKLAASAQLPEALVSLMKGLWEGVLTQSIQRFEPIETNYNQEIVELKAELEKYRSNNQRWQTLFNQWQQEKTSLATQKLTMEQALEFAHKENQSLHDKCEGQVTQLQEKQSRVEELHRLHLQTQANLEHYRESAREQRTLDQQQFEREKQQLMFEIKTIKEESVIQKAKYAEMNQQFNLLTHSHAELEKQNGQSILSVKTLTEKVEHLNKETIELQHTSKHWQQQCKVTEQKLENKYAETISLQSDNKTLNQQLADIKQTLLDFQAQTKLLSSQNWELMQEKNQLEGRLKQMQSMITA